MPKQRLDQYLHELGLTESREQARRLIMAGEVLVNGQTVDRPATIVPADAKIEIKAKPRFVSRGGEKLDAALERFQINVAGFVCADVGASTGGFTDCLLQRGAARLYAIDVGHGVLDQRLRNDPRVVVMEDTNARFLEHLPEPVQFVSVDASFISLKLLLPVVKGWLTPTVETRHAASLPEGGRGSVGIVALIKPQFEAGRKDVGKGGVVKDVNVHRRVLTEVLTFAIEQELNVKGLIPSPLLGPKGNVEFLVWLGSGGVSLDIAQAVEVALEEITK
jgi:23S rRNA (cytidine1920-2'-O)/16S rRNA (cytidine1409-2'-O)-methyltransferase